MTFKFKPEYRHGGDGMILWVEDNVWAPIYPLGESIAKWVSMSDLPDEIHPETGRSYKSMWEGQKKVLREALRMKNDRFVYRLIVFCWMRGEGKTVIGPCWINLWKFFCWPKQNIVLGANSKDQTKFVTYEMMTDTIIHSPNLLAMIGLKNIREKEIRLKDTRGNVISRIRSVASATGILSGATGYSFSEVFQMSDPSFFEQIDGSLRNVPNALGVIDSTVSSENHFLKRLYDSHQKGEDSTLFFSYRCSPHADSADFWHPYQTAAQLNSYKTKMLPASFDKYFRNTWTAGSDVLFGDILVDASRYIGVVSDTSDAGMLKDTIEKRRQIINQINNPVYDGVNSTLDATRSKLAFLDRILVPVDSLYTLKERMGHQAFADINDLVLLGDKYDTDFVIQAGMDRGDPEKKGRTGARTIITATAKGMPGSRSNPDIELTGLSHYIYFFLFLGIIPNHDIESVLSALADIDAEFDGLDTFGSERYGASDMKSWCDAKDIEIFLVHPTYDKQKDGFAEMYQIMDGCRFKVPSIDIPGSNEADIYDEEMKFFRHTERSDYHGWFGSPQKKKLTGIQDDVVFSLCWGIAGGKTKTVKDFRPRGNFGNSLFGASYEPKGLLGDYR